MVSMMAVCLDTLSAGESAAEWVCQRVAAAAEQTVERRVASSVDEMAGMKDSGKAGYSESPPAASKVPATAG